MATDNDTGGRYRDPITGRERCGADGSVQAMGQTGPFPRRVTCFKSPGTEESGKERPETMTDESASSDR